MNIRSIAPIEYSQKTLIENRPTVYNQIYPYWYIPKYNHSIHRILTEIHSLYLNNVLPETKK